MGFNYIVINYLHVHVVFKSEYLRSVS